MVSLEKYIEEIYAEFESNLSELDSLCQISGFNYKAGNVPDYNNKIIQQYYLLKYAYAYTYEYYIMYEQALQQLGNPEKIEIASLGCGALIDYSALKSIPWMSTTSVSYIGVDKINWGYKPNFNEKDQISLRMGESAASYLQSMDEMTADIYMFPKSICEFADEEISLIAECFYKKYNRRNRFCVCVSLRNTTGAREQDIQKAARLERAIIASGYIPSVGNANYYIVPEGRGINAYSREYRYPNKVVERLTTMGSRCKSKEVCTCARECVSCLNRYPILKTGEICYKMMTFERGAVA